MAGGVVFGPTKPPTTDWRWQEVLSMEPLSVMAELRELDVNLFAARSELREAVRELAELEDVLDNAKQQALGDVLSGSDNALADSLFKGGTKDERAKRQATYLSTLAWVQQEEAEIKVASERKDNAQVAFDSLLDRQTNLGRFANMYAATARLLASIRPPEEPVGAKVTIVARPVLEDEVLDALEMAGAEIPLLDDEEWARGRLFFVGEGKDPYSVVCEDDAEKAAQRAIAVEARYTEVGEETYWVHRDAWIEELAAKAEAAAVVSDDEIKAVAEAIVQTVSAEVEIPASMEVLAEDAEALGAAIKRHRGEAPEEEPPFQPDEDISL